MIHYKRSSTLFIEAQEYLVGGVNSPVRAFKSVGGHPIFIKEAKGAYLYDVDNNRFIDYIASWGPMILGHAHPKVIQAITEVARKGTSFGTPIELETELAKLALSMIPNADKIRFVNSGTEACMSAIRLARGYTGRDKIIKLAGCYHGHADSFLIQAGSGALTFGTPNSPGVTAGTAQDTLIAPYNDLDAIKILFENNPNRIAALILEPVAGNMGCILPKNDYLKGLRNLCDEHGCLLIFDEVMTGFRLAPGGVQEFYGIAADLSTYGKVIGGGLPVGALAGKSELMEYLAPQGPVYQAGTLSGNPLAMAAGHATLKILKEDTSIYDCLQKKTIYLSNGIEAVLKSSGLPFIINSVGSMISVHFTAEAVTDLNSAKKGDNDTFKKFFHHMLRNGIYLPPSAYESWFLNDSITYEDLDYTINAVRKFTP